MAPAVFCLHRYTIWNYLVTRNGFQPLIEEKSHKQGPCLLIHNVFLVSGMGPGAEHEWIDKWTNKYLYRQGPGAKRPSYEGQWTKPEKAKGLLEEMMPKFSLTEWIVEGRAGWKGKVMENKDGKPQIGEGMACAPAIGRGLGSPWRARFLDAFSCNRLQH